jgi:hypothetical protein
LELAQFIALEETMARLEALPAPSLVYAGARNFIPDGRHKPTGAARPVHLLKRGEIQRPGELSPPSALGFLPNLPGDFSLGPDSEESHRRVALAQWITDPRNALTWRSIVNRAWHHHFGRGLVSTLNDFGKMGAAPSHPELLDWLAGWFIETGGRFKELHRLILNSAVYQQSAADHPEFSERDADNVFLWRMNRARLDAESARDSILAISGKLLARMGGPSDQHFVLSPGIHVTPNVDYGAFDHDSAAGQRRGVYRFVFRTLPDPLMEVLDCPDSSQLTPVRNSSITASQALALWNDQFVLRYSEHFAERLRRAEPASLEARIRLACRLAWCREPEETELAIFARFADGENLASFCRVLLNSNEFMFIN